MFKIKLTYIYVSDVNLPVQTQVVIDSMTGNTHFPNPPVALADLKKARDEFDASVSLAQLGDDRSIAQKNLLREKLEDLLHETANYVMGVAKSDQAILASSGFNIVKDRVRNNRDTLVLRPGKSAGVISAEINGARQARLYYHQHTPDPVTPDSVWTEVMSTSRTVTFFGLEPGVKYWFRTKVITKQGAVIVTDAKARIIV
jgi:hypothetical protein